MQQFLLFCLLIIQGVQKKIETHFYCLLAEEFVNDANCKSDQNKLGIKIS